MLPSTYAVTSWSSFKGLQVNPYLNKPNYFMTIYLTRINNSQKLTHDTRDENFFNHNLHWPFLENLSFNAKSKDITLIYKENIQEMSWENILDVNLIE